MKCPNCQSEKIVKNGTLRMQDQSIQQGYLCPTCGKRFNERTNTPIARVRTPTMVVCAALNVRTQRLGMRATGRSFGKSHFTIIRWEQRLAAQASHWFPPAPQGSDVTLEGDEVYTHACCEPSPPLSRLGGRSSGRSILLSGRHATGAMPRQGRKRTDYLSKGH
jgi:transposase-like protein